MNYKMRKRDEIEYVTIDQIIYCSVCGEIIEVGSPYNTSDPRCLGCEFNAK